MKKNEENSSQSGITLVALVITIIVIIILATVSINAAIGNNGIVARAEEAAFKAELSQIKEEYLLGSLFENFDEDMEVSSSMPIKDLIIGCNQYKHNCEEGISLIQSYISGLDGGMGIGKR